MSAGRIRVFSVLFAMILVITVSGCVLQSNVSNLDSGVYIMDFKPEFTNVYSGEPVKFMLRVKNFGSEQATSGKVCMIGLGSEWIPAEGGKFSTCTEGCEDTDETRMFSLFPPSENVEGEEKICMWTYDKAPENIPEGMQMTYTPVARLVYYYKSTTVKTISMLPYQEMRRLQETGAELPSTTSSSSSSPVSITIQNKGPIRYWSEPGQDKASVTFPLAIKIENTGGGTTTLSEDAGSGTAQRVYNKIKAVTISFPGLEEADYKLEDCDKYLPGDTTSGGKVVELWEGRDYLINCKLTFNNLDRGSPVTKVIQVSAEYGYLVEKSTEIIVSGKTKQSVQ